MRNDDQDRLPDELTDAVQLLREEQPVRPEWRAEVLRRATGSRRVTMSIPWAIAAGVICAISGAAIASVATIGIRHSERVVSSAPAALPTMLPVKFSIVAPNAARVSIVGDFNRWNPTTLPLKRSADGRLWEVEVRLPLGRYTYAFMIDGRLAPDPAAPRAGNDDFGAPSSVLMVRGS